MKDKETGKISSKLRISRPKLFFIISVVVCFIFLLVLLIAPLVDRLGSLDQGRGVGFTGSSYVDTSVQDISDQRNDSSQTRLEIMTTTLALHDFAQIIGGDYVQVYNILPPGVDAHDYEPTTRQILDLARADALIYNGAGFESWIDKIISAVESDSQGVFLDASQKLVLLDRETGHPDPHVWLDPIMALGQAEEIRDLLLELDPPNQATYLANFSELETELRDLDQAYREELAPYQMRSFIVSHGAYNYLATRYNLEAIAITGIHPGVEPSQQQLKGLIDLIQDGHHAYIFFEPTVSNKIAQVVADASGAEILHLHPVENFTVQDIEAGATYLSLMRENLTNLKQALR